MIDPRRARQSKDSDVLENPRKVQPGEIDHEIATGQLQSSPSPTWDAATLRACEAIYRRYVKPNGGALIPDAEFCDLPRWVFLEYAVKHRGALLQGCKSPLVDQLKPMRLSLNIVGWEQPSHIAFSSSVEAIFNAVLETEMLRELDCPMRSTIAFRVDGSEEKGFYFGLDYRALPHGPWRNGTVYIYSGADFPEDLQTKPFHALDSIRPLARVNVSPQDWPMLDKVQGVDVVAQTRRHWDTYTGYPWRHDDQIHPHLWKRPLVEEVRKHIDSQLAEPANLVRLGKIVGSSPFTMLRMFRAEMGVTPQEYQNRLRIDRAKALLKRGAPIAEVAVDTGFCDQAHLTRQFRKAVSLTPGQYIRVQESSIHVG